MQAFVDHIHDRPYRHAQRRHTRVYKIPCHKSHEMQNGKDRRTMLRKVIWKQWKTPSQRAWRLRNLWIDNDLAKLTAYSGDHYEWVVIKTCVTRAISKDILTRRCLVRSLDYYMIRHSLKTN